MNILKLKLSAFFSEEEGLTTVEYVVGAGLLVAGLAVFFAGYAGILTTEFASLF
ncbi:hypothetical protein M9194_08330 [Vibrio sp. S4M6]|uniref:hypothetical protein n=1 Tax=Vibrio sinus TaxID=2946865 RepID=UPI00202A31DE|nr:hypothetical protein [Vibrio sinus]MCL9781432.1 hypothetical protein [Vibrio sinus]